MFSSAEEVLRFIAEENVEFVDVRFCDLPGTMQHFTVPTTTFGEGVFTDGLMFDGSSIRGFQQIHESDMQLLPDPSTDFGARVARRLAEARFALFEPGAIGGVDVATGVGRRDPFADGQGGLALGELALAPGEPCLALGEHDLGLLLEGRLLALEALLGLLQRSHPVLHRPAEPACGLVAGRLFRLCLGVAHGVRPLGMRTYGWSRRPEQAVLAGVAATPYA